MFIPLRAETPAWFPPTCMRTIILVDVLLFPLQHLSKVGGPDFWSLQSGVGNP